MAGYKISVGNDLLPGLMNEGNGLAKLVETVLNQVLEAQMSEPLGAGLPRAQRGPARLSQRVPGADAVQPCGTGDATGAAGARRELLDRHLQALPAVGADAGADGNGRQRGIDAQGHAAYRGVMRGELLPVDGEHAGCRARAAGAGVQWNGAWRAAPTRS